MGMNKDSVLRQAEEYVRRILKGESTGHDWWHAYRVWKNSIKIGEKENADMFVIQLAALLHDIADWKLNKGDESSGLKKVREFLEGLKVDENVIDHVCEIINNVSFRGADVKTKLRTKEAMVVQDADRLDALGAIGIARTLAYGGYDGREIHNPGIKPRLYKDFEEYKNSKTTSINHFYEKLLLIKDLMNTETAKKIAEERHKFTEQYLDEFLKEWEGLK